MSEKQDIAVASSSSTPSSAVDETFADIDEMVRKAQKALEELQKIESQELIDSIVHAMALAGLDAHEKLARMAVEETGRGVYEDKVIKNMFATEYIWHDIKKQKTVGVLSENDMEGTVVMAEPIGVVCGVTPTTNPTSTTLFKCLICMKTRNPVIFGFHPSAQACSAEAAKIVMDAAMKAGAPADCIQWIKKPSIAATNYLMNHAGVATILATGGAGMVKSAYSTGKPALGVGPGNVPCYIEKTANLSQACTDLIMSKTFDNGMICASEQAVIVDEEIHKEFEAFMVENNCHLLTEEETAILTKYMFPTPGKGVLNHVVGKTAEWIAQQAGIKVAPKTKILLAKLEGGPDESKPLSKEKLSPVLAYFVSRNTTEGFAYANKMLELGGLGHSAVIHTSNMPLAKQYGEEMRVGRIIVNSPSSQGAIGDIYNGIRPSLTIGCGSYGGNSVSSNVSISNLINTKTVAKRRVNMQWFKIAPKIYFERDSIQYLEKMPHITRAFIVSDAIMVKLGNVDKLLYYLRKRPQYVHSEIYSDVEPDPDVECIMRGVEAMNRFQPDVIIALGGGSAIDAAKGMWLFYEHPDTSFDGLRQRFLDIRKRSFAFPQLGKKAQFVAIPTTSGTGSEVTSFSVITDRKKGNIKYPLADYELTPDVAIIDPQFTVTQPKSIVADCGMDVLTHCIEAYVSVMASDYTDGLALQGAEMVLEYLERSYKVGDELSREKMHNASCIAGMAFTNAFLGLNHSMAHKLGGEFHIPHGRANSILLPYVIRYNAQKPTKFALFPKYARFQADERYAKFARRLGLPASTTEEGVESLINEVKLLAKKLNLPSSIKEYGIDEKVFFAVVEELSYKAFEDQCTTANPRYPLVTEIKELFRQAYYGE
ncbi:bifunctional acetaldehyde-CoA/alcohol dehydrogenase (adhE) [Monocercomonoides exilis]|uniref:bifunctional acetaldehyde-CoA/alcohol dehydrogenase (adhE) n=1 Tax=Monocercomonoides exilis TaxID=2049356 RepID=UPI00355AB850|nr:bifunctional acetaldehyde-CoA/alcohol dehydrogenase (adhE) [Monocercomonoides exilis]|eukprot:MONOS_10289.1-p1 / transcript=MONOS_10289.1 / gene=MONOS_10289 / organism=Monocercomonoides_exilis_PA203 / gene_product=bifunctional acetaldehyde-CoA/alcohol dehydrogenase (adhE) / transcript_product=bifunctional acetaldehyde-CoA/alcohol dehydrogenase (adhE) / location=Mono_scaffold00461:26250-28886(-) / protein_length=879 / sequence_SO=supercontig / SO=protein_coding / is_pseudo=false